MLAAISEKMFQHGLSMENVTTDLRRGRSCEKEFVVSADSNTTKFMNQDDIKEMVSNLNELKQELNLDHMDIRVRRYEEPDQGEGSTLIRKMTSITLPFKRD
jgi:hypothetical protein